MDIDIFIKSYKPDFWLLGLSLETIKKNVTGYKNLILIIPDKDKHDFETRYLPDRTLIHYISEYDNGGWLFQQNCKMNAYRYCNSEYIMFSDSDCLFDHSINLQDYIIDGKPEILYTAWENVGDAIVWRDPTERFMKDVVPWEMMRRNNQIYHRSTLLSIAGYEPNLEKIIMGSEKFSEFNCMSSYAYKYEKELYRFVNTADWEYVPPLSVQVWSHASKEAGADELHLREYIRVLESILKAFNVKVP